MEESFVDRDSEHKLVEADLRFQHSCPFSSKARNRLFSTRSLGTHDILSVGCSDLNPAFF